MEEVWYASSRLLRFQSVDIVDQNDSQVYQCLVKVRSAPTPALAHPCALPLDMGLIANLLLSGPIHHQLSRGNKPSIFRSSRLDGRKEPDGTVDTSLKKLEERRFQDVREGSGRRRVCEECRLSCVEQAEGQGLQGTGAGAEIQAGRWRVARFEGSKERQTGRHDNSLKVYLSVCANYMPKRVCSRQDPRSMRRAHTSARTPQISAGYVQLRSFRLSSRRT